MIQVKTSSLIYSRHKNKVYGIVKNFNANDFLKCELYNLLQCYIITGKLMTRLLKN